MSVHAYKECDDERCDSMSWVLRRSLFVVFPPVRGSNHPRTLESLFGHDQVAVCPLADETDSWVMIPGLATAPISNMASLARVEISAPSLVETASKSAALLVSMTMDGYAQQEGRLSVTIRRTSPLDTISHRFTLLLTIPHFLLPLRHTLRVAQSSPTNSTEGQAADDILWNAYAGYHRPTTLELIATLTRATTTVSVDVRKVFLAYTEHPPDANRGFDLPPARIQLDQGKVFYTNSVLVSLPTPDFTMPYNVITLTCTVVALFFGSVFNTLTRHLEPVIDAPGK